MATYIPILGNFDAPFSIVDAAAAAVLRDAGAASQGDPRPGTMKTSLQLIVPDATVADDQGFVIGVASPYVFTAADLTTSANSYRPLVSIMPDPGGADQLPSIIVGASGGWDVVDQIIFVNVNLNAPTAVVTTRYNITIDFSHTLTS